MQTGRGPTAIALLLNYHSVISTTTFFRSKYTGPIPLSLLDFILCKWGTLLPRESPIRLIFAWHSRLMSLSAPSALFFRMQGKTFKDALIRAFQHHRRMPKDYLVWASMKSQDNVLNVSKDIVWSIIDANRVLNVMIDNTFILENVWMLALAVEAMITLQETASIAVTPWTTNLIMVNVSTLT